MERQGREGRGCSLYVKKWIDCTELSLKNSNKQVENLWVKIRGEVNKGSLAVGVYYRPPDLVEPVDEVFLLQLQKPSNSQALTMLEDFNHLDVCWKSGTVNCMWSRSLL